MLTLILVTAFGWVKKALSNPIILVGILMVCAVLCGRFWGKASCENAVQKEVIKEIKVYIKGKDAIVKKYQGNTFTAEQILSGCVAEATKDQPHCRGK